MKDKNHIAVALLFVGQVLFAQDKPLPLDPAVRTGKLPNGFTYFIRHNEEPKNRVTLYLANKVGSALEDEDQRGLAHFMEHMSFNGTKHFPKNELIDYLQKSGVRFGADINAYTSFDETVYQLPLPTDNAEVLKNGLQIMRDWADGAVLDPIEIDKERGVVLEEQRLGQGSQERMRRQYWPLLLNGSRYASRIPIGTETVLKNFKPGVIQAFYKDWYRPDLQALIVVGDVDVADFEKRVKAIFSDLKNPVAEKARTKYRVSLLGTNQFMAVTDKEMTATVAQIFIKHKASELKTKADYRKFILRRLYNQMLGARFNELSRQSDPPFVQAGAAINDFIGGLDYFGASLVAKSGELEKGVKAVWREVLRAKRFGFTQTELDRVKRSYLSQIESAFKEKNKTNSEALVNEYLQYFLRGTAAQGISAEFTLVKSQLPSISLAEINALGAEYIQANNRDALIMAPEKNKASLPGEVTFTTWLKAVDGEKITAYQDEINSGPLLSVQPDAGKIVSEKKDVLITTLVLSNGYKVILKPTNFKNDEIRFYAFASGGTSLVSDVDYQSAANAANVIGSFGAGNYGPNQLQKFMEGKQALVQTYISERSQGVVGLCVPKDLETALQLVYARLTAPRMDSALFKNIISRAQVSLMNRADDPNSVFQDSVSAILGNYSLRRTGPTIAKLAQINLGRSYSIYKEKLASPLTFVFVGSFDDGIKPLIEKYIGSLPTSQPQIAKDLGIHPPGGKIEKNVYKGIDNKATVRLVFSGLFDYTDINKGQLDALKECLELRLLERLREEESGVYSPGVIASATKYPEGRYSFTIAFGCSPVNVDKLIASTLDEVKKLKTAGPPQVNIDKYIAEEKRQQEVQLKTNNYWVSYLSQQIQDGEPLDSFTHDNERLQQLTPESVKTAAQKYLSDNYIRLVLLPEKR